VAPLPDTICDHDKPVVDRLLRFNMAYVFMAALRIADADIIFLPCGFFL